MEKAILNESSAKVYIGYGIMATFLIACLLGFFWTPPVMVTGTLERIVMLVIGYYFGSSIGSKIKEIILKKINGG